jgi:hypothetical protein
MADRRASLRFSGIAQKRLRPDHVGVKLSATGWTAHVEALPPLSLASGTAVKYYHRGYSPSTEIQRFIHEQFTRLGAFVSGRGPREERRRPGTFRSEHMMRAAAPFQIDRAWAAINCFRVFGGPSALSLSPRVAASGSGRRA